jgi:hypothetical protein
MKKFTLLGAAVVLGLLVFVAINSNLKNIASPASPSLDAYHHDAKIDSLTISQFLKNPNELAIASCYPECKPKPIPTIVKGLALK